MNFLIIGAGAIGCLVGGKLAMRGHAVTLVGRPRFALLVREQGLRLSDDTGNYQIRNITVASSLGEAFANAAAAYDLAIFTVKAYDTANALAEFIEATQKAGIQPPVVLSLQNGIGNEEELAAALGAANVIAGSIGTPVSVPQLGTIQIDKAHYTIGVCPWQPNTSPKGFEAAKQALSEAGFVVKHFPDPYGLKWSKLLMNMVGNATSAILDEAPRDMFTDVAIIDLEIQAMREALAVMQALNIAPVNFDPYPFKILAPLIRYLPKMFIRRFMKPRSDDARGIKMPSLNIDLSMGKTRSEIFWLNAVIVRIGQEKGIPTPVNQVYTTILIDLVKNPQNWALWKHDHKRLVNAVMHQIQARPPQSASTQQP